MTAKDIRAISCASTTDILLREIAAQLVEQNESETTKRTTTIDFVKKAVYLCTERNVLSSPSYGSLATLIIYLDS